MSTVFALSSAPGPAGVAVVRVTGPQAGKALRALSGKLPRPRQATLAALRRPVSGEVLDRGLVLWFPAPASVTGEDVAELQIHGGRAVVRAVLDALAALPGLAQAEPGDFTRRAFQNGKLDLTQVEALADLVNAETEGQRRQAQRQMDGELGQRLERWRTEVLRALAHVEAAIDFGEDEVPPAEVLAGVAARVHRLVPEMEEALGEARRGERLRTGVQITIVGPPNAGKSSLLNAIAGRDAAIVSSGPAPPGTWSRCTLIWPVCRSLWRTPPASARPATRSKAKESGARWREANRRTSGWRSSTRPTGQRWTSALWPPPGPMRWS